MSSVVTHSPDNCRTNEGKVKRILISACDDIKTQISWQKYGIYHQVILNSGDHKMNEIQLYSVFSLFRNI